MTTELSWTECLGAIHHARWMWFAIYILKMLIVGQDHYRMGVSQAHRVLDLAYFTIYIYFGYWFSIPVACLHKLDLHTWYLSPRHVPLALFSKRVDYNTKIAIVKAMQDNPASQVETEKPEKPRVYEDSKLESFVSSESWLFFELLGRSANIFWIHFTRGMATGCFIS